MTDIKRFRRTLIIIAIILLSIIVVGTTYEHLAFQEWNVDYINAGNLSTDKKANTLYYTTSFAEGDRTITLYRTKDNPPTPLSEDLLCLGYWWGNTFPNHEEKLCIYFNADTLSQHTEQTVLYMNSLETSYNDQEIAYNLYLNPTRDTLTVNGEEVTIEKIPIELNGQSYTIGFWYKLFPKDTQVTAV